MSRLLKLSATVLVALLAMQGVARAADGDEDRPAPEPPKKNTVHGLVDGGGSVATLFGIRSTAVHVGAGMGLEKGRLFVPFGLDAEIGKSSGGLGMGDVTMGVGFQGIVGALRAGGGFDMGYAWITRTTEHSFIGAYAVDAFALATVDLFAPSEHGALYIGLKPSVGLRWGESLFAFGHGTVTFRGAVVAGIRF